MKYALITGGTKGIGKAVSKKLLSEGYFVFINFAHDNKGAKECEKELQCEQYSNYKLIQADASEAEGIETMRKTVTDLTSHLHVLVLNAGLTDYEKFGAITWENWNKVMNTNLSGPFFLIQSFKNCLEAGGSIIAVGSVLGHHPHARSVAYGVSKAGIEYLMKMLVKEFSSKKIRLNAVSPGFTDTDWQKEKVPELRERIEEKIAAGRFGAPEEIASAVWAIIGNSYINGAVINVDGGYSYY